MKRSLETAKSDLRKCTQKFEQLEDLFSLSADTSDTAENLDCSLPADFRSLYHLSKETHRLSYPPSVESKLTRLLGGGAREVSSAVRRQTLIRLANRWSSEEMVFNRLRSRRPGIDGGGGLVEKQKCLFEDIMSESRGECDLCNFREMTAYDDRDAADDDDNNDNKNNNNNNNHPKIPFHENARAASFSNLFPFSGWQTIVIPKKHSALDLTMDDADAMAEILDEWFASVSTRDSDAVFRTILIDFMKPAGASQPHLHVHGIAQADFPAGKVRMLNDARRKFGEVFGGSARGGGGRGGGTGGGETRVEEIEYLDRLFSVHEKLGLCIKDKKFDDPRMKGKKEKRNLTTLFCSHLTPIRNREIVFSIGEDAFEAADDSASDDEGIRSRARIVANSDAESEATSDSTEAAETREIMRAIFSVMKYFFSIGRFTFSGAVYLPTSLDLKSQPTSGSQGGDGDGSRHPPPPPPSPESRWHRWFYPRPPPDSAHPPPRPASQRSTPSKRRRIHGRFLPRALLGADYSDFGTLDLYVRSVVDVDPFKAARDMKNWWEKS